MSRRLKAARWAAGVVVFALTVTGCAGKRGGSTPSNEVEPTSGTQGITAPPAFNAEWAWSLDVSDRSFAIARNSGRIIDTYAFGEVLDDDDQPIPSTVVARWPEDGSTAWTSAPLKSLATPEPPVLGVLNSPQGEIAVVARVGTVPGTGLARDQRVMTVDAYRVNATGEGVAPLNHLELEVPEETKQPPIAIGDGGVLVYAADPAASPDKLWDTLTGAFTDVPPPGENTRSIMPTAAGMLVATELIRNERDHTCEEDPDMECQRGFGIAGKWTAVPGGDTEYKVGVPLAVTPTAVVAGWWNEEFDVDAPLRYTIHDLITGKLVTSVDCPSVVDRAKPPNYPDAAVELSSTGRYVVLGSAAFDVSAGTAVCLAGDARTKGITLWSAGDTGIAYGGSEDGNQVALVRLPSGKAEALPDDVTAVPVLVTKAGYGVFYVTNDDDELTTVVVIPAAGG